ncbi:MAG: hypothetical protein H7240_01730 [Glaciimonas sp.]|nr:hypothetical protein [Glaciimonas sp.]
MFNQKVIGWSLKPRMTIDSVMDALKMVCGSVKDVQQDSWITRIVAVSTPATRFKKFKEFGMFCSMQ